MEWSFLRILALIESSSAYGVCSGRIRYVYRLRYTGRRFRTIFGPVEDEFDTTPLQIIPDGPGKLIIPGGIGIAVVNRQLNLQFNSIEAETLSGLLTEKTGEVPSLGDRLEFDGGVAEVFGIRGSMASSIRVELSAPTAGEN